MCMVCFLVKTQGAWSLEFLGLGWHYWAGPSTADFGLLRLLFCPAVLIV